MSKLISIDSETLITATGGMQLPISTGPTFPRPFPPMGLPPIGIPGPRNPFPQDPIWKKHLL